MVQVISNHLLLVTSNGARGPCALPVPLALPLRHWLLVTELAASFFLFQTEDRHPRAQCTVLVHGVFGRDEQTAAERRDPNQCACVAFLDSRRSRISLAESNCILLQIDLQLSLLIQVSIRTRGPVPLHKFFEVIVISFVH